jgi:hypothetical protein
MNKTLISIVMLTGVAHADAPWCATPGAGDLPHGARDLASEDVGEAIQTVVGATCRPEGIPVRDIAAARARWTQRLEMTDADWRDAAEWAVYRAHNPDVSPRIEPKQAWSTLDPVEQFWRLDSLAHGGSGLEGYYVADALGSKLTELGRVGFIDRCLDNNNIVDAAICAGDIAALDVKQASADIRASKRTPIERFSARVRMYEIAKRLPEQAAKLKQALGKDAAYARVFDIANAARKGYGPKPALVELAAAMDDARVTNSRKAFDGCSERAWQAWRSAVSAIPAKRFANMRDPDYEHGKDMTPLASKVLGSVVGDPDGYLAAIALYTCEAGDKRVGLVRQLGETLARWPGYRGPRTAAISAFLGAGIELDDRNATLAIPEVRRDWFERSGGGSNEAGTVKTVKRNGDTATIEFATKTQKIERCVIWHTTKRIVAIRGDGALVYEEICDSYGAVTLDKTPAPATVRVRYVDGLKPGMFASIEEDAVAAAWAKPGDKMPAIVFGAPVK